MNRKDGTPIKRNTTDYIKIEDLVVGKWYMCSGRNLGIGRWTGKGFVYLRLKWHDRFPDVEYHWDTGAPHGTCKPIEEVEPPPELVEALKDE